VKVLRDFSGGNMRDLYSVLREKEIAIERLRREIEVLRSVCNSLFSEGDFRANILVSRLGREEETVDLELSGERENVLGRSHGRLVAMPPRRNIKKMSGRSVLLQFRQVGLDASRMFLRRVLDSPLLEHEPQRKSIRDLYERLGRISAA
jgi:hypothetical protein